jgi:hypothetical protein
MMCWIFLEKIKMLGCFMSDEWRLLHGNRVARKVDDKFYIIQPMDFKSDVPTFCPTCRFLLRDRSDVFSFLKYTCCSDCSLEWAQPNRQKWTEGWRPSKTDIDVFIKKKKQVPSCLATL